MKKEGRGRKQVAHKIVPFDSYTPNDIKRKMLMELNRIVGNKDYRLKRFNDEPWRSLPGKDAWMLDAMLGGIDETNIRLNQDLMKIHKDSMWMLDNIKTELDDLFKQSVEAEKRLKAASTQYEAAIFKSIEETSEAINGAYQRLTTIDQNLVKLENSMKMELQTRMANLTQKFEEIRDSINATLKENKERIAYLWQQIEDSEKRIKDATMTTERNILTSLDTISASSETVQARVLEIQTGLEALKEESRSDLVQVGNELMDAVTQVQTGIIDQAGLNAEFQERTDSVLGGLNDKIASNHKETGIQTKSANEKLDSQLKLVMALDKKLDKTVTEMSARLNKAIDDMNAKIEANFEMQEKTLKKETEGLTNGLTALKSELEVLKHITLEAIKPSGRR